MLRRMRPTTPSGSGEWIRANSTSASPRGEWASSVAPSGELDERARSLGHARIGRAIAQSMLRIEGLVDRRLCRPQPAPTATRQAYDCLASRGQGTRRLGNRKMAAHAHYAGCQVWMRRRLSVTRVRPSRTGRSALLRGTDTTSAGLICTSNWSNWEATLSIPVSWLNIEL